MPYKYVEHIPVDKNRLVNVLKEQGVTLTQAAEAAGYTQTWLSKAGVRGFLTPPQAAFLRDKYGINREDVAPVKEEVVSDAPQTPPIGANVTLGQMTQGDLYETLSDAFTDAMRSVKAELQRVVHDAVRDALSGGNQCQK